MNENVNPNYVKGEGKNTARKTRNKRELPDFIKAKPIHVQNMWSLFSNNAEVRRYVSNTILNYLTQTGVIAKDAIHKWVKFDTKKFTVSANDLSTDYSYSNPFFANCFAAGFTSFAANAQNILNDYLLHETGKTFDKVVNPDEVNNLVEANENIGKTEEDSE